jgi:hypothetical protein
MTLLTTTQITLTHAEMRNAAIAGVLRQADNMADGLYNAYGLDETNWGEQFRTHLVGYCAEQAVAKFLHIYASTGERGESDVGAYQVRYAGKAHYSLIVHPDDDDTAPYVLVVGGPYTFNLIGWIWGADAKQGRFWSDPAGGRAAYFVPQGELYPLSEMPIL